MIFSFSRINPAIFKNNSFSVSADYNLLGGDVLATEKQRVPLILSWKW